MEQSKNAILRRNEMKKKLIKQQIAVAFEDAVKELGGDMDARIAVSQMFDEVKFDGEHHPDALKVHKQRTSRFAWFWAIIRRLNTEERREAGILSAYDHQAVK